MPSPENEKVNDTLMISSHDDEKYIAEMIPVFVQMKDFFIKRTKKEMDKKKTQIEKDMVIDCAINYLVVSLHHLLAGAKRENIEYIIKHVENCLKDLYEDESQPN